MIFFRQKSNLLKKSLLTLLTLLLVAGGSLFQQKVLQVNAAVQVLLVSRTAIAFGDVFPGENSSQTYTVQLDTSANSATYVTTLDPLPGLLNLCPFLNLHSIDSPPEPDTLASATLTRPGDVLDNWQVQLNTPGIKGELSQDHNGGIIVQGGDFGCKITITTNTDPTRIIICKQSLGGSGSFNYTGSLGNFTIQTTASSGDDGNNTDPCGTSQNPCPDGSVNQTAGSDSNIKDKTKCITITTVNNSNTTTIINNVSSSGSSGGNFVGTGNGDIKNGNITSGNSSSNTEVDTSANYINSNVNTSTSKNGSGSKVFDNLSPGIYNVTESTSTNWTITSLVCKDPSSDSVVSTNKAAINVSANETVICTFTNTIKPKGKIIIQKKTVGGNNTFWFYREFGAV